jgi:hypothetical protein
MKLLLKMNAAKVSRLIKRLKVHGLIKKKWPVHANIISLNRERKQLLWRLKLREW